MTTIAGTLRVRAARSHNPLRIHSHLHSDDGRYTGPQAPMEWISYGDLP